VALAAAESAALLRGFDLIEISGQHLRCFKKKFDLKNGRAECQIAQEEGPGGG
jgi:hypothetical protein